MTPVQQPVQAPEPKQDQVVKRPIEDPFKPMVITEQRLHGPIQVDEMYQIGEEISTLRPTVPSFPELGLVDIHALTMSLKSGIHAEVRLALDTLTTLSCHQGVQISLENAEDLVESLVDCADDQADLLSDHIQEVSDVISLRSYEDVTRGCQSEHTSLANVPEFGSLDYELDRAVDRLICITTIFRNLSFSESNFGPLGVPSVTQCFANVFRNIGTRDKYLRTDQNLLDFMKDAVIFMSNLAHVMQIPGKEEALSLLHFLLAFSPLPGPIAVKPGQIMFAAFNPSIHRYTPAATDALAKLLARDDPNRIYFGAIFSGDGSTPPQPELLTRTFGLAVCAIPDKKPLAVADARMVFLMQGLLAADVLTTFADGALAKLWLGSVDGFAIHLLRVSCLLCTERLPNINPRQGRQAEAEAYAYTSIIHRGLAILRRLAEKSKQVDNASPLHLPSGILPSKESLLGALLLANMDPTIIRQLLTYANLAE
jgi:SWI/SNF chromatin-remodeling complex subunit SWI1